MGAPLHIVSLADRGVTGTALARRNVIELGRRLRRPIGFEHICLPPSPVLLSDLLFVERFGATLPAETLAAVRDAHERLRAASVIIVDDIAEMAIPGGQAYAALSHDLVRNPLADLITVRRQRYPALHHLLPVTFVAGCDLPLAGRTESIAAVAALLGKPIFRVATIGAFAEHTAGWDYRSVATAAGACGGRAVIDQAHFLAALEAWIVAQGDTVSPSPRAHAVPFDVSDLGHYCSHFIRRGAVDAMIDRYASFCLAGQLSSAPYVAQAIERAGKSYVRAPHYAPGQIEAAGPADYEVIVSLGPQGEHPTARPVVAIDSCGMLPNPADDISYGAHTHEMPESARDWHCPFAFARDTDRAAHEALAEATQADKQQVKEQRRARRAAANQRRAGKARRERPIDPDRAAVIAARDERRAARDRHIAAREAALARRKAGRPPV